MAMENQINMGHESLAGQPARGTVELWPVLPDDQVPNYGPYVGQLDENGLVTFWINPDQV